MDPSIFRNSDFFLYEFFSVFCFLQAGFFYLLLFLEIPRITTSLHLIVYGRMWKLVWVPDLFRMIVLAVNSPSHCKLFVFWRDSTSVHLYSSNSNPYFPSNYSFIIFFSRSLHQFHSFFAYFSSKDCRRYFSSRMLSIFTTASFYKEKAASVKICCKTLLLTKPMMKPLLLSLHRSGAVIKFSNSVKNTVFSLERFLSCDLVGCSPSLNNVDHQNFFIDARRLVFSFLENIFCTKASACADYLFFYAVKPHNVHVAKHTTLSVLITFWCVLFIYVCREKQYVYT